MLLDDFRNHPEERGLVLANISLSPYLLTLSPNLLTLVQSVNQDVTQNVNNYHRKVSRKSLSVM